MRDYLAWALEQEDREEQREETAAELEKTVRPVLGKRAAPVEQAEGRSGRDRALPTEKSLREEAWEEIGPSGESRRPARLFGRDGRRLTAGPEAAWSGGGGPESREAEPAVDPWKREEAALSLARAVRKVQAGADGIRERSSAVIRESGFPRAETGTGEVSIETLDRSVERDARRYDGGFGLW